MKKIRLALANIGIKSRWEDFSRSTPAMEPVRRRGTPSVLLPGRPRVEGSPAPAGAVLVALFIRTRKVPASMRRDRNVVPIQSELALADSQRWQRRACRGRGRRRPASCRTWPSRTNMLRSHSCTRSSLLWSRHTSTAPSSSGVRRPLRLGAASQNNGGCCRLATLADR